MQILWNIFEYLKYLVVWKDNANMCGQRAAKYFVPYLKFQPPLGIRFWQPSAFFVQTYNNLWIWWIWIWMIWMDMDMICKSLFCFTCAKIPHKKVVPSSYLRKEVNREVRSFDFELSVWYLKEMGIRDDMPLIITKCQSQNFQRLGNITIVIRLHVSPCDPAYSLLLMLVMLLLLLLVLLLLLSSLLLLIMLEFSSSSLRDVAHHLQQKRMRKVKKAIPITHSIILVQVGPDPLGPKRICFWLCQKFWRLCKTTLLFTHTFSKGLTNVERSVSCTPR